MSGQWINATFLDLDMQSSSPCKDVFAIGQGENVGTNQYWSGCTMSKIPSLLIAKNVGWITFKTDGSGSGRGFKGEWRAVPDPNAPGKLLSYSHTA